MSVQKNVIKDEILKMMDSLSEKENSDDSKEEFAEKLSSIISDAILSAEVVSGIPVSTTGSAAAQTGATTSTGKLI